jgi:hypothetical protein
MLVLHTTWFSICRSTTWFSIICRSTTLHSTICRSTAWNSTSKRCTIFSAEINAKTHACRNVGNLCAFTLCTYIPMYISRLCWNVYFGCVFQALFFARSCQRPDSLIPSFEKLENLHKPFHHAQETDPVLRWTFSSIWTAVGKLFPLKPASENWGRFIRRLSVEVPKLASSM